MNTAPERINGQLQETVIVGDKASVTVMGSYHDVATINIRVGVTYYSIFNISGTAARRIGELLIACADGEGQTPLGPGLDPDAPTSYD